MQFGDADAASDGALTTAGGAVEVVGVVLAGGGGRRLGGRDKALVPLAGRPLIAHAIARAAPQVQALAINANGDPDRFAPFGLPVIGDGDLAGEGPLAGVLAGLAWAAEAHPSARYVMTVACDTPFFPMDLGSRLVAALQQADGPSIAVAESGGRLHPVFALWPLEARAPLERAVRDEGARGAGAWIASRPHIRVAFAVEPADPFWNVNTPHDLQRAAARATLFNPSGEFNPSGKFNP